MGKKIIFKIKRQLSKKSTPYWEVFELDFTPQMNIVSALIKIQKQPITKDGKKTEPVNWECSCLEEVCGSCTMLINGVVKQACSSLVKDIIAKTGKNIITLEPLSKFPVIRDLQVDRSRIFENLKKVKAWVPLDGVFSHQEMLISDKHFSKKELSQIKVENLDFDKDKDIIKSVGTYINRDILSERSPKLTELRYKLSLCMSCGACIEACPQVKNSEDTFMGAAIASQVRYFNLHPKGKYLKKERTELMMGSDGISNCGNAQLCVKVCPKKIPLTESLVDIMRDTTNHALFGWFSN